LLGWPGATTREEARRITQPPLRAGGRQLRGLAGLRRGVRAGPRVVPSGGRVHAAQGQPTPCRCRILGRWPRPWRRSWPATWPGWARPARAASCPAPWTPSPWTGRPSATPTPRPSARSSPSAEAHPGWRPEHSCGSRDGWCFGRLLQEVSGAARDAQPAADHDEERPAGDGGRVPRLRDTTV
jgi:hypothetical protein